MGGKSDVPGIKLALAQTVAQAGGTRVLGQVEERQRAAAPETPVAAEPAPATALPRTGLPFAATSIPVLLGASAGLRVLVRRKRTL
jgi:hypothetical protein